MTLNKKKEIIKGLLLIAVLIFFIWGLLLTINEDFIYADGTVYVKEASQYITADRTVHFDKASKYVTLDNQFTMLPSSFESMYIDDFKDGTKVTCRFVKLPFDNYMLTGVYERRETE